MKLRIRRFRAIMLAICVALALLVPQQSQAAGGPRKLSDPSVIAMQFSPDSSRVVYLTNNTLYSIATSGGQAIRLNGPLANGYIFEPFDFKISPDSARVIYAARQTGDAGVHLYTIPLAGGTPVKLKPASVFTEDIGRYEFTPNGQLVVFRTFHHGYPPTPGELFSAPIDGSSSATRLNLPLTSDQTVQEMEISPDSSRVVYLVSERRGDDDIASLYRVPITGGSSTPLTLPSSTHTRIPLFAITQDSSRVIYAEHSQTLAGEALYSVPIVGGEATELPGPAQSRFSYFWLTSDGSYALFLARTGPEEGFSLYSAPLAGNTPAAMLIDSQQGDAQSFKLSPNGERVAYLGQQNGTFGVYSVPVGGGEATLLSNPAGTKGAAADRQIFISPDSSRVVYFGEVGTDQPQLFSVPIAGSATPTQISNPALHSGTLSEWDVVFTPNSQQVLYRAEHTSSGYYSLYRAPIDGTGAVKKISQGIPATAGYLDLSFAYSVSPDSRQVVFAGGPLPQGPYALYIADLVDFRFTLFLPGLSR